VRRFRTVIGTRATPTPRGRFFVEEAVRLAPGTPGGPFALALSARSNVLQEFAGGPGQTAVHGTRGLPGRLGSRASHGCLRVSTRAIAWLAGRIDAGTPVRVRG
jgi:lipoprotein-anchoring transpeptidase ErfK/SrfK